MSDVIVSVALSKGGFVKDVKPGTVITFWYNNPTGRGSKGWRKGVVRESQNEYILTYDEARKGETRKFKRRCMTQLTFV